MSHPSRRPAFHLGLAVAILAGCAPGPASVRKSPQPVPVASTPAVVAPPVTNLINAGGGNVISNNSGNLIGKIKVPAGLVSDHGSGVIANNGSNIIGNNSSSWRLLAAPTQLPYVGATVKLLDAAGQPVLGPDGKPLTATTDGKGAYSFKASLPARNLLLDVELPEAKGAVRAIVPREGDGQKVVDVDLVSTLTTGYILEQYVKPQADPLATLEKLPATVERETREKAAAAVAANEVAPAALQPADVVKAVDDLRKKDASLDQQLETVKKLLVVAGASELGQGLKATEVTIKDVSDMVFAPDGTLYLLTKEDARVWRLGKDGLLATAAGSRGTPTGTDLTGQLAGEASLDFASHIALDPDGNLVILEKRGVYRVGADGKLTRLTDKPAVDMAPGKHGELVIAVKEQHFFSEEWIADNGPPIGLPMDLVFYRIKPGAAPEKLFEQAEDPGDDGMTTVFLKDLAWDGGNVCYASFGTSLRSYDFTTRQTKEERLSNANAEIYLDGVHAVYYDEALVPHGKPLFKSGPEVTFPKPPQWASLLTVGPDGLPYAAKFGAVYRLEAGGPVRIAGTEGNGASGSASVFTFEVLGDSAVAPSGDVYAMDTGKGSIYKVDTNRQITRLAGIGGGNVQLMRTDKAGNVYMSDGDGAKIGKLDAAGNWSALFSVEPLLTGYELAADGSCYATAWTVKDRQTRIYHLKDGVTKTLDAGTAAMAIALDPAGTLYAAGNGQLRKWNGTAFELVKADERFTLGGSIFNAGILTFDAKGRLYMADAKRPGLFRFDLASGIFEDVAGAGTKHFGGSGTDDGIKDVRTPRFDAAGNLYFSDTGNRQVKRIAAGEL